MRRSHQVKDYRAKTQDAFKDAVIAANGLEGFRRQYVRADAPKDREGLIAVFHPLCIGDDDGVESMAMRAAKRANQRVYHVLNEYNWHLLILAGDDGEYDGGRDDDRYAGDQYIGFYEPNGEFTFVGAS